jgi:23S rRNA pseudouridine1911/1915/1917 synthase
LVIAKNEQIQFKLSQIFADRLVSKTYLTVVYGHSRLPSGKIETLIGRHPVSRKKMAVVSRNGKEAITHYRVLKSGIVDTIPMSFLEVDILTGRTHQIRVHLAYKKLPVLGDSLYGGRQKHISDRQLLHAYKLSFPHPETGKDVAFEAPIPDDMKQFIERF